MDLTNFSKEIQNNKKAEINENENLKIDFSQIKKDMLKDEKDYFLPWFIKYRVKDFDEITKTKETMFLIDYIKNKDYSKAVLVYGHPGCGKTTTINFLANHFNLEIVELNASDFRSKNSIKESLGRFDKTKIFFFKRKTNTFR